MLSKRLVWGVMLILGTIIWAPLGFADSVETAEIVIFAGRDDSPDTCENGLKLGYIIIDIDNHYVARWQPPIYDPNVWPEPYRTSDYFVRSISVWYEHESYIQFWRSQYKDETTYFCGKIIDTTLSPAELTKLTGTLITQGWVRGGPSLKLTFRGPNVKVEPLQACCSPEGECVKEHVPWGDDGCPSGTISAGKTSICQHCSTVKRPAPRQTPDPKLGVCCFHGGYCYTGTAEWCKNAKGRKFLPDKQSCDPNPCLEEIRGCCLPEGTCRDMPPEKCNNIFLGAPLPRLCEGESDPACDLLTGACCLKNGTCNLETKESCDTKDKTKFLAGVKSCSPSTCIQPKTEKGACCVDGKCDITTKDACENKGKFLEGVTECKPETCPKPEPTKGGCCYGYGVCINNVLEVNCPEAEGNTFFPGGCPETCPQGACYFPCPTSADNEDCMMMSENGCATISGSRFELNRKCVETGCLNCTTCQDTYGTWVSHLPEEHATLILNSDCTSLVTINKQREEYRDGLPVTHPLLLIMDGSWGCSDQTIRISWEEGDESAFSIVWEGDTMNLCYPDGDKTICFKRSRPEVTTGFVGTYKGVKEGSQP